MNGGLLASKDRNMQQDGGCAGTMGSSERWEQWWWVQHEVLCAQDRVVAAWLVVLVAAGV